MQRALVLSALIATACATTPGTRARMLSPPDGEIAVTETPAGNQRVDIRVAQLAPPSAYQPRASSFVVWIVPQDGVPVRAGELDYDGGARAGSATVFTPYEDFRVLLTAEEAERFAVAPSDEIVVDQYIPA